MPEEQLSFGLDNKLYISIFDQDKIWRDIHGYSWKLEEMESSHRSNLIRFLERSAERFHIRWEIWHMFSAPILMYGDFDDSVLPWDPEDDPDRPMEWLTETPLYQRLVELEEAEMSGKIDFSN